MKSFRSSLQLLALLAASQTPMACGDGKKECVDDRSCDVRNRCVIARFGEPGTCEPCDEVETPYDGQDNDCSARTPDSDLDEDGDNWVEAAQSPGTDCDDNDYTVNPATRERCGDGKDNDCDGQVDERDCGDFAGPTVSFLAPNPGVVLHDVVQIRAQVDDDVGVTSVSLRVNGNLSAPDIVFSPDVMGAVAEFTRDSTIFPEGEVEFEVIATDIKGNTSSARIKVTVDNRSGPEVKFDRPGNGRAYGGQMTAQVEISDPSGVGSTEFKLDGLSISTTTTAPGSHSFTLDTLAMAEGPHQLVVVAVDSRGSTTTAISDFSVDNTPPTLTFQRPAPGEILMGTYTFEIVGNDASGIHEVYFTPQLRGANPLAFSLDTRTLLDGPQTLTATASDEVEVNGGPGHTVAASVRVSVQNGPPLGSGMISTPLDGARVFGRTEITSAYPAADGKVEFIINGQSFALLDVSPWSIFEDLSGYPDPTTIEVIIRTEAGTAIGASEIVVHPMNKIALDGPIVLPIGFNYRDFSVMDANGDGIMDLMSLNRSFVRFGTVGAGRWLPGGRSNQFEQLARASKVSGSNPPLIAFAHPNVGALVTRLAGPSFATPSSIPGPNLFPDDIAWIDLLGNGLPKLLIASGPNVAVVDVSANGAPGAPDLILIGPRVTRIQVVDLDLDGDPDVVIEAGGVAGGRVWTMISEAGVLGPPQDVGPYSKRPVVGDITGDGVPDIVSAGNTILVGSPSNPGSYTQVTLSEQVDNREVALIDSDQDGVMEILRSDGALLQGTLPNLNIVGVIPIVRGGDRLEVHDLDGDGIDDIVNTDEQGSIYVTQGLGGGRFSSGQSVEPAPGPAVFGRSALMIADLVGSPAPDIVVGGRSVFESLPTSLAAPISIPGAFLAVSAGDANQDGILDLITPSSVLVNDGSGGFVAALENQSGLAGVADVDGDGLPELVANDGGIVLVNPTDGTILERINNSIAYDIRLIDLDGDPMGIPEIVYRANEVRVLSHFTGAWVETQINAPATDFELSDLDLDGNLDLLTFRRVVVNGVAEGTLSVNLGAPGLNFASTPTRLGGCDCNGSIHVGDVNDDGVEDVVVTDGVVLIGTGNLTFINGGRLTTGLRPASIDIDGDGVNDWVGASPVHALGEQATWLNVAPHRR